MTPIKRVLSIQSHVASGYVGNRSATFPLQILGWDVDVINTVQYSNHNGYRRLGGPKTSPADLQAIIDGLGQNGLLRPDRLLTGYIPNAESLNVVASLVAKLRKSNPGIIYVLDPVMGDDGRMYVAQDILPIYRDICLPLADIITPNYYEVELLTGIAINSVQNLQRALKILHEERHVPDVVISSLPLSTAFTQSLPPSIAVPREPADNIYNGETLLCVCSSSNTIGNPNIYAKAFPRIRGYFAGVGDIFSALVLAHYSAAPVTSTKASPALPRAVSLALITTASVILRTRHYYVSLPPSETPDTDDELDNKDPERRVKRMRARELRLIQSMDAIRAPNAEGSDMKEWSGFWEVD